VRPRPSAGQLGLLFGAVLAFGLSHSAYFLLPKYLELELHADPSNIGLYMAATWFTNVVLVSFAGVLIDARGRLPFALLGAAAMAVCCLGFLAVDSLGPLLFALRIVHGVAFTFFFVSTQTLAADMSPPEKLGQVLGYYGSGFVITNAAAPALAEWVAGLAGWRTVFVATAVLAFLALGLLGLVREQRVSHADENGEIPGIRDALARPGLARVMAVCALTGIPFAAAFTFYQPFALSLGIERVADFLVSYSITAMIVRGPLGGMADRAGRLRVTAFSLALYVIAAVAMTGLARLGLVVTGAAFGAAHGLFYPALNAHALENAPPGVRAKVTGLFNGAFNIGFSVGSLALGYVALHWGYTSVYGVGAACAVAALVFLPRSAKSAG
jgi:predicted MFS family arabinose efflux permease